MEKIFQMEMVKTAASTSMIEKQLKNKPILQVLRSK